MHDATYFLSTHIIQILQRRSTFNLDIFLYMISFNSLKKTNRLEKKNKKGVPRFKELNKLLTVGILLLYIYSSTEFIYFPLTTTANQHD